MELKNRLGWDDALDVWAVHGVGGTIRTIMLGLFADKTIGGVAGLLAGGGPSLLMKQTLAVAGVRESATRAPPASARHKRH